MKNQFIIWDTEYASWEGFIDLPPEKQKEAEIVQIAAIKVDLDDLSVVEELCLYIKPHFKPKLTEYFIKLTGITDQLLEKEGIVFPDAYRRFKEFAGNLPCYSHGWSLNADNIADGLVMNNNLELFGLVDKNPADYRNIANWFKDEYSQKGIRIVRQSSGQVAKLLGCEEELKHLNLDEHNALYDVYSILAGLRFLGFNGFV